MRKLCVVLIVLSLLNISGMVAFAAAPLRVAILPVYVNAYNMDEEALTAIEKALAAKFHTALSGIVPVYQIIPASELTPALPVPLNADKRKIKLNKPSLISVAEKLDADIVIAAVVDNFSTSVYHTREGDLNRNLNFSLRLLSYHRPSGEYIANDEYLNYIGTETRFVQPDYVAKQSIDILLGKVPNYR